MAATDADARVLRGKLAIRDEWVGCWQTLSWKVRGLLREGGMDSV